MAAVKETVNVAVADGKDATAILRRREDFVRNENRGVGDQGDAADPDVAMNHQLQLQRIVGVGAGDNNAASHPIYHGPWQ